MRIEISHATWHKPCCAGRHTHVCMPLHSKASLSVLLRESSGDLAESSGGSGGAHKLRSANRHRASPYPRPPHVRLPPLDDARRAAQCK